MEEKREKLLPSENLSSQNAKSILTSPAIIVAEIKQVMPIQSNIQTSRM